MKIESGTSGPAQPAAQSNGGSPEGLEDVSAVLSFDPFDGISDGDTGAASAGVGNAASEQPAPATPTEGQASPPTLPEGASAPQGATPPAASATDSEMAALRAQLTAMQQAMYTPREPAPQPAPQQEPPAQPQYQFNLPADLLQQMEAEDPVARMQGYARFAQGIAMTVHQQALAEARQMIEAMPQQIEPMIQQRLHQQHIFQDFYGTHKELNKPELYPLVVSVAQQVAREKNISGWNPELRDAVAARVKSVLGLPAGGAAQPPVQNGVAQAPASTTTFQASPSARPATPTLHGEEGEMLDMLRQFF